MGELGNLLNPVWYTVFAFSMSAALGLSCKTNLAAISTSVGNLYFSLVRGDFTNILVVSLLYWALSSNESTCGEEKGKARGGEERGSEREGKGEGAYFKRLRRAFFNILLGLGWSHFTTFFLSGFLEGELVSALSEETKPSTRWGSHKYLMRLSVKKMI